MHFLLLLKKGEKVKTLVLFCLSSFFPVPRWIDPGGWWSRWRKFWPQLWIYANSAAPQTLSWTERSNTQPALLSVHEQAPGCHLPTSLPHALTQGTCVVSGWAFLRSAPTRMRCMRRRNDRSSTGKGPRPFGKSTTLHLPLTPALFCVRPSHRL